MKVLRKILLGLLFLLALLPVAAVVALQLPSVQKGICNSVSRSISSNLNGSIEIGDVYYALFDRVIVKDALMKDAADDTVAYIGKVYLNVRLLRAITGHITVRNITVSDALLNLEVDRDGTLNMSEIFPPKEKERDTASVSVFSFFDNVLVDMRSVRIEDMAVNLVRHTPDVPKPNRPNYKKLPPGARTINWKDMHLSGINVDISDIRYNLRKQTFSLSANSISVAESRGYKLEDMHFKAALDAAGIHVGDFRYIDNFSDLKLDYANALFEQFGDFSDFLHKVTLDCCLSGSRVSLASLGLFLPGLDYLTLTMNASGTVYGPVANMKLGSFTVDGPADTHIELSGQLNGLPLSEETILSADIDNCHFNMAGIENIVANVSQRPIKKNAIGKFAPGTRFNFKGFLDGFFTDFVAYGGLSSNIGEIDVDLLCKSTPDVGFLLDGFLDTRDFDLGRFLQTDKMGEFSCNATLGGLFAENKDNTYLTIDSLYVSEFNFNDYDYKGITASGTYDSEGFQLNVVDEDPNLDFRLSAGIGNAGEGKRSYDIDIDLKNANLSVLNFDSQELSLVSMKLNGNILQTGSDSYEGGIRIYDLDCTNTTGLHDLGDIQIDASLLPSNQQLTLNSSFLNGRLSGTTALKDLAGDVKYALLDGKLNNLLRDNSQILKYSGGDFNLNLAITDIRQLLAFVMPDMHIENGTSLSFKTDTLGRSRFSLNSDLLSFKEIYARDVNLTLDGADSSARLDLNADLLRIGSMEAYDNSLAADIKDNQVRLDLLYNDKGEEQPFKGNLKATLAFPDTSAGYKVLVALDNSTFTSDSTGWSIPPSSVFIDKGRVQIRNFTLESEDQYLKADGIISASPEDSCMLNLHNFDMSLANLFLKDPLKVSGRLSGNAKASALLGDYAMSADMQADSVCLSGNLVGRLAVNANWAEQDDKIDFSLTNTLADKTVIDINGDFHPSGKMLTATAVIDSLSAAILSPFASSIMSDLTGSISLAATASGPLDSLDLQSGRGHLNDFSGTLDYTKVRYGIDGDFSLTPAGIRLRSARLTDGLNGIGTINGGVSFDHFKNMRLDLRMRVNDMTALNTTAADNPTFYGNALASNGEITLSGPLNDILLNVNATTGNSSIRIPLGSTATATQSILTFVNNTTPVLSSYDSLLLRHSAGKVKDKAGSNFGVKLRLQATNDAEINLDIDKTSGNTLKTRGNGVIDISVINGQFDIRGNYGVDEGSFNYKLLGLTNKVFSINKGGTVNFTGNVMETDLNVTAEYDTKAAIAPLMADSISASARKNVRCLLDISGKLSNPQLGFNVDVPDIEPSVKAKIEPALMTEEKRMKQFVAVLLTGNFVPDDASGINYGSTGVSYLNIGELMANQLNDILEQLNIPIDLGLNYQNNDSGRDVVDVAISTQLFNNRVTINGNIGNRQYNTAGKSDVMGNIDIAIKLGNKGRTTFTLFSHSPEDFSSYLDQTQRNGVGIAFSKEFDNFKEFFSNSSGRPQRREPGGNQPPEGRPDRPERPSRPDRNQE